MTAPVSEPRRSLWSRLYHGQTNADIVGRWKLWFALSGVVVVIGLVSLATNGLNMGIDFTGGTVWEVEAGDASVVEVQDEMAGLGYRDVQVQEVTQSTGGGDVRLLRVEAEATASPSEATERALGAARSGLEDLVDEVPEGARDAIAGVRDRLDGIEGPFAEDVPAQLRDLRAEIDALPGQLDGAEEPGNVARDAATSMREHVDQLSRLETEEQRAVGQEVSRALSELTGTPEAEVVVDTVGPSWGKRISDKARTALVVFLLAIMAYITIRFEVKMAAATVVALLHDLAVVVGLYSLFDFAVTPATVVALLTMLGFSIYDGIVVFDRVDENTKLVGVRSNTTYSEMANRSLNQVLMRSLNTSITSLLPILSVLIVGAFVIEAGTLEEFGLALFLGLLSGAYSSLFIATPLLALLKEREPANREVRERLLEDRARGVRADAGEPVLAGAGRPAPAGALAPGGTPRPRRRKRR